MGEKEKGELMNIQKDKMKQKTGRDKLRDEGDVNEGDREGH